MSDQLSAKLTTEQRNQIVQDNRDVFEHVVAARAAKGEIDWSDFDDWVQSLITLTLEWDYVLDRYDPEKPLYPFLARIFHGMLSDRYTSKDAFDSVTGDRNDYRISVTDIETATEIIGIGAVSVYDREDVDRQQRVVELDQVLLDGVSEFLRQNIGEDYYTVYQLSRLIKKASDIAAETGIPVADIYTIKQQIERVSKNMLIGGKSLHDFRVAAHELIRKGQPVGELPEFTFGDRVDDTDRSSILNSVQPRINRNWSEKYDDQGDREISSAEIFRLMGDRVKRYSNPYEWLKSMMRKGLIRVVRTKGDGNHTRYYYDRKSAMELITLLDMQQGNEAIEAVRDRLHREAGEAENGMVPIQLRAASEVGTEPALDQ